MVLVEQQRRQSGRAAKDTVSENTSNTEQTTTPSVAHYYIGIFKGSTIRGI